MDYGLEILIRNTGSRKHGNCGGLEYAYGSQISDERDVIRENIKKEAESLRLEIPIGTLSITHQSSSRKDKALPTPAVESH